ncbi:MAG: ABC transporter substrate-binding protein [Aromatoleum sp.]|jgi:phospholipid transport system substrate-binding protein|uniref:MlaC/ttg2D family ABC transporter substrate-binding protein n=1 Tax=Aromatoleum sp. TaxID=2307007 RepID=UPI002895D627|nr:ABC transporter substrate-binding protein [Aromatoleum sp.]MDT3670841.1 ABC transporter substrate-binding protein [Aromatoleum sp.]
MKRHFLSLCFVLFLSTAAAAGIEAPDLLVRDVSNDVLTIVRKDEAIQAGDTRRVVDLVEAKVLPHFNFRRMTMLAVGKDWRQATPEQQAKLIEAFRTLLVRTYSNALTQYRDQTIEYKPLRVSPSDTTVRVQTEIRQAGAQPVQIDYALEKTEHGWKVFDVIVAGVSLVTNYRGSFAQEVRAGGIEGLIRSLQAKTRQLGDAQQHAGVRT